MPSPDELERMQEMIEQEHDPMLDLRAILFCRCGGMPRTPSLPERIPETGRVTCQCEACHALYDIPVRLMSHREHDLPVAVRWIPDEKTSLKNLTERLVKEDYGRLHVGPSAIPERPGEPIPGLPPPVVCEAQPGDVADAVGAELDPEQVKREMPDK